MVTRVMRTTDTLALLSKHKQLIIVVIGIAALASYMIPFGSLFAIADASYGDWKKVTSHDKKDKFKPVKDDKKDKFKPVKHDFKKDFFKKFFSKFIAKDSFNTIKTNVNSEPFNIVSASNVVSGAGAVNLGSNIITVQNNVQVCVAAFHASNVCVQDNSVSNSISTTIGDYNQFGGSV